MNRRTNPRAKVDVLINRFLDGQPYVCRMTDISSTGLRIVPLLEPKGDHRFMGLQFELPGTNVVVTASGEAMNHAGERGPTGVRFTRLPGASAEAIRRFVEAA